MSLIDIGGYRLDLRTTGDRQPAVVCISSAGGAHDSWMKLSPLVTDLAEVITYGRPRLAGSDPLPPERQAVLGAGPAAQELHALLHGAAIAPPYVLVGGSVGGYIADQFAACWPNEVAGLVLIDPSAPYDFPGTDYPDVIDDTDGPGGWSISRRAVYAEQRARVADGRSGRFVILSAAVGTWSRIGPRPWQRGLTLADIEEHWTAMQRWWAERLGAVHLGSDFSDHHVAVEHPELAALVVREVVEAARAGRPVEFDDAALATASGHRR